MTARLTKVLATVVLLLGFLGAADAAFVEDAWCQTGGTKSYCIDGADLVLSGGVSSDVTYVIFDDVDGVTCDRVHQENGMAICTLTVEDGVEEGSYAVSFFMGATPIGAINVLIGAFNGLHIPLWTMGTVEPFITVIGQTSDFVRPGVEWCAVGTFDPTQVYNVFFYNIDPAAIQPIKVPVCASSTVSAVGSSVCCKVTADAGVMGRFRFLVQDSQTHGYVPHSTIHTGVVVTPSLPVVTEAVGECATDNTKCVDGAELVFTGRNFNHHDASYNTMMFGSSIICNVSSVATSKLTCTLWVLEEATEPVLLVARVRVQLTSDGVFSDPHAVGTVTLQYTNTIPGWTSLTSTPEVVDVTTPSTLHDGDILSLFGKFATDSHELSFHPIGGTTSEGIPSCVVSASGSEHFTCVYRAPTTISGLWTPLLQNTVSKGIVSTSIVKLTLSPPTPMVVDVSGITGASTMEVTFTGSNFRVDADDNRILTAACTGEGCNVTEVSCTVKTATEDVLVAECECGASLNGVYTMEIQTRVRNVWYERVAHAGYLSVRNHVFVEHVSPVFNVAIDSHTFHCSRWGNPLAVGFSIAFGVSLALIACAVGIVLCCYRVVRREDKNEEPYSSE